MIFKKKTKVIISLALGTLMFTTTALAQVLSKSGYDQLKDAVKYTAENCTTIVSSYTMDTSISLKDNGTVIFSENSVNKTDVSSGARENVSTRVEGSSNKQNYNYDDRNGSISKSSEQDVYYVNEYTSPREDVATRNPFKEKEAADVEKIADALVGSLKDAVVVTENADGTKTLSGSLSESQIPALINAVVSLQSKSEFGYRSNNDSSTPRITKDVFVKEVKGNMVTTKEGFIQNVLGSGVISGKDESGKEHNLTFELLVKITNVNSTKVSKPNLSGKEVEKNVQQDYSKLSNPEKYIGKYKNDILIEKDGKFEKIGERFLEITTIDDKNIIGRHYEEYAKGYEGYAKNKKDFEFNAKFEKDQLNASFNVDGSSSNNKRGNISINPGSAKIYFYPDVTVGGNVIFDDQYSKVFN